MRHPSINSELNDQYLDMVRTGCVGFGLGNTGAWEGHQACSCGPFVPYKCNTAALVLPRCQMEAYFAQPTKVKMRDVRPDMHYQIGATPGLVETPKFLLVSVAERLQVNACGVAGGSRT